MRNSKKSIPMMMNDDDDDMSPSFGAGLRWLLAMSSLREPPNLSGDQMLMIVLMHWMGF